jgi:signal transduction histidine kinase
VNRALKFRRRLGGAGLAFGLILFCAFYFAFRVASETQGMNFWIGHTQEVLGVLSRLRLERSRMANEIWAYRETKMAVLPQKFQEDKANLEADLAQLKKLTADNPEQQVRLVEVDVILRQQIAQLDRAMQQGPDLPKGAVAGSHDWSLPIMQSERLGQLFEQMEGAERQLLKERTARLQRNTRQTHAVLELSALLSFVTLSAGLYLVQREILKRALVERGMRQAQELLGVKYDEQHAELSHAVRDLHEQIVERRAAEEKAHVLNLELEERVNKRTADLQEMNKEMESFSYSVSHDLRAPLRHLQGFSRILREQFSEQLPEEGRQYLDRIRDASTRMAALVEDLLHISRIGSQVVQHDTVRMNELVQAAKDEALFEASDREIEWRISELPNVQGDALLLRQVLANLIGNAVKFTKKKAHAVIEIGHQREGNEDVFFVRDNGAGFDMKYADKLFGVFQRLHRQDEFEGTGIGLATVQRILYKHGGRVWPESELDQGATFYFSLPAVHKQS